MSEVIPLPHSSGPGGVVIGGATNRCRVCIRLRNEQAAAWVARNYRYATAVQHRWLEHWDSVHTGWWGD